jgi:hypothetical protein
MSISKDKMGKMTEDGSWTLESYTFDDVEVLMPAPEVAIIAYTVRQKVVMDGKPQDLRAADSSTWVRGPRAGNATPTANPSSRTSEPQHCAEDAVEDRR